MRQRHSKERKSNGSGRTSERQPEGLARKMEYLNKAFSIISDFNPATLLFKMVQLW